MNWTFPEEASQFVSLADHCAYRQLLHLPGNSYAGGGPGWVAVTSQCGALPHPAVLRPAVLPLSHWLPASPAAPGRLKYLMACGSAVVMPESPWAEFW